MPYDASDTNQNFQIFVGRVKAGSESAVLCTFRCIVHTVNMNRTCSMQTASVGPLQSVAYPGIFFWGGSPNSVEDRRQREPGSGGSSPLVRDSTQFANK
jgi:hypothetical protein